MPRGLRGRRACTVSPGRLRGRRRAGRDVDERRQGGEEAPEVGGGLVGERGVVADREQRGDARGRGTSAPRGRRRRRRGRRISTPRLHAPRDQAPRSNPSSQQLVAADDPLLAGRQATRAERRAIAVRVAGCDVVHASRAERRAGPGRRRSRTLCRRSATHAREGRTGVRAPDRRIVTVLRQGRRHLRYGRGQMAERNAPRRRGAARAAPRRLAARARGADPHRVALVLEGGGMRGVVSAGMTAALERLGLTPCFDLVVGASAGAINGAALLSGAAQRGRRRLLRARSRRARS